MEEMNLITLWKEQSVKIDRSLAMNKKLLRELINQKAHSALRSLTLLLSGGIVAAVLYLALLGTGLAYAVIHYSPDAIYFIVSIGAIFLINIKALFDYIRHLVWANNIDYGGDVMQIQQKLMQLNLSIIRHIRIMFLQLPFWTTFFLNGKWFPQQTPWYWILFQIMVTGSSVFAAYWLYKNLTIQNVNKKIIKKILNTLDRRYVARALDAYEELEEFREK